MLTEERHSKILELVNLNGSVQLTEICDVLSISESTARRDLKEMADKNLITRVHGGAISINEGLAYKEANVAEKSMYNNEEKQKIAKYAASLVEPEDFIFLDAGTSTEKMINFLPEKNITVVTTGLVHAIKLAKRGIRVIIPEGEVKGSTEALIGAECVERIRTYNFTKSFIGTNGISIKDGLTTPDKAEAMVKMTAIAKSKCPYVLADHSKFDSISAVTFAALDEVTIITDEVKDKRFLKVARIEEA